MNFFTKCPACKKFSLVIKVREYKANPPMPAIKSQNKICRTCYKNVKKLLKTINK